MRVMLTVALVVALAFAGCSGKKKGDNHEEETYDCPDGTVLDLEDFPDHHNETFDPSEHCPEDGGNGNGNGGNTTPNVPPVLVLKAYDAPGGNETNVTLVGGSLTFSAEGSSDPDGTISGIAVTVTDSNQTRTLPLYAAGQFVPATFDFDRQGVVTVTAAMVDERAGFSVVNTFAYVNSVQVKPTRDFALAAPPTLTADGCEGTAGGGLTDAQFRQELTIDVEANASFISVTKENGGSAVSDIDYAICSPERAAMSEESNGDAESNNAEPLPASLEYYLSILSRAPQSAATFTVTVHYEPKPAA